MKNVRSDASLQCKVRDTQTHTDLLLVPDPLPEVVEVDDLVLTEEVHKTHTQTYRERGRERDLLLVPDPLPDIVEVDDLVLTEEVLAVANHLFRTKRNTCAQ